MSYASDPAYIARGFTVDETALTLDDAKRAVNGQLSAPGDQRSEVPGHHRRLSAIPGGGLPYPSSDFSYQWYDLGNGEYYADSRDGGVTLGLDLEAPGGQVHWQAEDDIGVLEEGNFSGMDRKDIHMVLQRADRLMSQFDSAPSVRQKNRSYDSEYAELFDDTDWRSPAFRY